MLRELVTSAGMAGMDMLGPAGLPVTQAPPSHLHPHAAVMMQHAAAVAQPNSKCD